MHLASILESLSPPERLEFGKRLALELIAYAKQKKAKDQALVDIKEKEQQRKNQTSQHLQQLRADLDNPY
jgi:hypothetical protein